jgi:hypothetical protein
MNRIFKNIIVLLVVLMSSIAIKASNSSVPKLRFKEEAPNTIVLKVSAVQNPIQIVLQSNEGGLLFTETLEKGYSYKKKYDLSNFSNGIFYIKIVEAKNVKFYKIIKGVENKIEEVDKLPFE